MIPILVGPVPTGPRHDPLPEGAFPAASLVAWMAIANEAGVAAVPAEVVASLSVEDLLRFEEPTAEAGAALAELERLNRALPEGYMLRWDCCAPLGVKRAMAEPHESGRCDDPNDLELFIDDPRAYDILYEFPADTVDIVRRPWVAAESEEGFPIEFRVFVRDGEVVAVSNYYPQRDLTATPRVLSAAGEAVEAARQMMAAMRANGQWPWMGPAPTPEIAATRPVNATLDFLITPEAQVLFLEAGPGFPGGAHPCCFHDPHTNTVAPVEGLRLSVKGPALALPK